MKRLIATLWLALYMVRHFWLRAVALFTRAHARHLGLSKFSENYREDGTIVLTPEEVADFGQFSRCIRCGLCDVLCANTRSLMQGGEAVSLLASTHSRGLADAHLAETLVGRFTACGECVRCFDRCPTQVPILRVVARLRRLGTARRSQSTGTGP